MKVIYKILSFFLGTLAAVVLIWGLMLPIALMGGSRPAPFYGLFAAAIGVAFGRWVYKRICSFLLKKKDKEKILSSESIVCPNTNEIDDVKVDSTIIK